MSSDRRGGAAATIPEADELRDRDLPRSVERLVDIYDDALGCRDRYIWGWLDATLPTFGLDCVPPDRRELTNEGRLLVSLYVTILNDLSDRRDDHTAFEAAARVPADGRPETGSDADDPAVRLAAAAWETLLTRLSDAPRFEAYRETLEANLAATADAQRHTARTADDPTHADYEECLAEQSPTMCMDALATVDLICSPGFDPADEPAVREAVRAVEPLGRIGNWLTTWERELAEGDLANGVVVRAVESGAVSPAQVERARTDPEFRPTFRDLVHGSGVERAIGRDWRRRFRRANETDWDADSVDLDTYVAAMDTVRTHHDASHGYK
ncbi:terpene synthase family protein [Candidatus Halobonum tyrrellensis]|uniref:Terpene synthase n=1 Tax=Candidatus Halobonum tyrrellensis G22 TaxID=1324957 RepID=V4HN63_9EURY|nr:hypothetical protein [Candidatus Halobonum tyrrellensis]ESP89339.1 hypothetical protein K933_04956 [Candidatus Halobonum tyrrellensis G22]